MKARIILSLSMFFLMNMSFAQQTLDATIDKSDAGEVTNLGSAKVNIKGGTAPYYVLWSSGSTKTKVDGLKPGNYVVRISDSKGATIERKIRIEDRQATALNAE